MVTFKVILLPGINHNAYLAVKQDQAFQVIGPLSLSEAENLRSELEKFFNGE